MSLLLLWAGTGVGGGPPAPVGGHPGWRQLAAGLKITAAPPAPMSVELRASLALHVTGTIETNDDELVLALLLEMD